MNRKSRLRSKASYQYKPAEVMSEQNPVQPVNPVSRISIPEKEVDADMLMPAASTKQVRQVTAIENAETRKKGYRRLDNAFVIEQPKVATLEHGQQLPTAKPKVSQLRFERKPDSPVSALQFGRLKKASKIKKQKNLSIAPAPWIRNRLLEESKDQEDQNSGTEALQAIERTAYTLQSKLRTPRAKSNALSVTSLRQQAEAFATDHLKSSPVKNPVLRYIQKQRIKREYIRNYRAAASLHSAATRPKIAREAKKIFSKVVRVFKSRSALYASIALALFLLVGSLASFAVSATTVMGGNIIGGLAESLRGSEGMVEVARSQLGQVGGEPYWSWYGFPSRVEWCAIFVSWVADQNGYIAEGRFPKFAGCSTGESWFRSAGAWQARGYQPSPGEVIFFDWDGNGVPDHVGIVESSDGSTVYTIEGNWGDSVHTDAYPINSPQIHGYGTPNFYE